MLSMLTLSFTTAWEFPIRIIQNDQWEVILWRRALEIMLPPRKILRFEPFSPNGGRNEVERKPKTARWKIRPIGKPSFGVLPAPISSAVTLTSNTQRIHQVRSLGALNPKLRHQQGLKYQLRLKRKTRGTHLCRAVCMLNRPVSRFDGD